MRILLVGKGGRAHAMAWKLASSEKVSKIYVAPGNAGSALEKKVQNVPIEIDEIEKLVAFAKEKRIDFALAGPAVPLTAGLVDRFTQEGLRCFGSLQKASQLEASKAYAKAFLKRHNIPTPEYEVFTDKEAALSYLDKKEAPIVVKADGLASGKGVIVAQSIAEAKDAVIDMLEGNCFGSAGSRVVIEEYVEGEECSFVVMSDGKNILPMVPCQDHKRKEEGDTGVNTGGMGAYSPVKPVTPELTGRILKEIVQPTIHAMREKEHTPYTGFLYTGIMIDKKGDPKVLEYNCRFGDPEAQPTMMRLQSDFAEHIVAALEERLDKEVAQWDERSALCVVLAPREYPEKFQGGAAIYGLERVDDPNIKIFHSGTTRNDKEEIITTVGRTLSVTALGDSIEDAQKSAYEAVKKIEFEGVYYRKDIGYRAMKK